LSPSPIHTKFGAQKFDDKMKNFCLRVKEVFLPQSPMPLRGTTKDENEPRIHAQFFNSIFQPQMTQIAQILGDIV